MTTGDYDGDGRVDLAVLLEGTTGPRINVYRNEKGLEFREAASFAAPLQLVIVASGDIDGDGRADLVIGGFGSNTVAFGSQAGLDSLTALPLSRPVRHLVLEDLDSDGRVDIAACGTEQLGRSHVTVLMSRRERRFDRLNLTSFIEFPHLIVPGDYNGDGAADLAVWGKGREPPYLLVYEGAEGASFTFREPRLVAFPNHPREHDAWAVASDFDGDARDEVLLLFEESASRSGVASFFTIQFTSSGIYAIEERIVTFGTGADPLALAADVDRDGNDELILLASLSATVSIFEVESADLGLGESCDVPLGGEATWVEANDFDRDGKMDLALALPDEGRIELILAAQDQCGRPVVECLDRRPFVLEGLERMTVGDFGGTGHTEALVAAGSEVRIISLLDSPSERAAFPAPVVVKGMAAGDLNGDGRDDVALTDFARGTVEMHVSNEATWTLRTARAGSLPQGVVIAELSGDGALDLAVSLLGEDRIAVFTGRGDGGFLAPAYYPAGPRPDDIADGDVDGDGRTDLLVANPGSNRVSLLRGVGEGRFAGPDALLVVDDPRVVELVDVDGNGLDDVVVASHDQNGVTIYLSQGDSFRLRVLTVIRGARTTGLIVEDLDGDGNRDIAIANSGHRNVLVFHADGEGDFVREPSVVQVGGSSAGGSPILLEAGDVTGDGSRQLLVGDSASETLWLYRSLDCPKEDRFRRGDVDGDGRAATVTDGVQLLHFNFLGAREPPCLAAADANGDGEVAGHVGDAVYLFHYAFLGGPPPAPPFPDCGTSESRQDRDLGCRLPHSDCP